MIDLDHELQERLNEVENGATPEQAAAHLPADAAELRPLVQLAATVRETPHPAPSPFHTQTLDQKLAQASREMHQRSRTPSRRSLTAWMIGSGFAAVMLMMLCMFALGTGIWLYGPPQARAATLQSISGTVEIAPAGASWQTAEAAATLRSGWTLRTGPDGSATLAFYDGTRTTLGPDSEVSLTQVGGRWGGVLQVTLDQVAGVSTHQVVPFHGKASQFIVNTPAGQASVHGTTFSVAVDSRGRASFGVDAGEVKVTNANRSVSVLAGQATFALPNNEPQPPVYQFSLVDVLTAIEGDIWTMGGVSFRVTEDTILFGEPQVGDVILARGRILPDGWVADLIQASPADEDLTFQFCGVVEAMGEESWLINGVEILVNEVTEIDDDIEVGDSVRVTYILLDGGRWLALEIDDLSEEEPPTVTPTVPLTPTATLTPTPWITPTATLTVTVTATPPITVTVTTTPQPTLVNCTGADPQPKAQKLAEYYGVPYEEIMGWFCQGFGFGEIDLAYSLSLETGVPVADIFAMKASGMGWGNIKKELTGSASNPKDDNGDKDKDKDKDKGPDDDQGTPQPGNPKDKDKNKNKDKDKKNP